MEVIMVAGYPGSGKDEFAEAFVKRGWKKVQMSDLLKESFKEEYGREPADKNELAEYGLKLRKKKGRGAVAELLKKYLEDDRLIVVGLRSPEEYEVIVNLTDRYTLIWIESDERFLVERRGSDVLKRIEKEKEMGIDRLKELADIVVENNGSLEEFKRQAEYILENIDWYLVGLRAGLEIHQQLNTKKLFCNCPSELSEKEPDYSIIRNLRPVPSETGEYDRAALVEFMKGYDYIYQGDRNHTCLVELDEEPPLPLPQKDALDTALMMCRYMNMNIFPYVQTMRKIVIDGSNTTGFQRTMLIGYGGYVEVDGRKYGIQTLCLEEDAARPLEKTGSTILYNLDRLGIPLIEIATKPDIRTPSEVKAVAERIGMLLRATGKVRRGLGTIRQDINVSIRNGARIEIKGVQDLSMMAEYVKKEVERQLRLLELKDLLNERDVEVTAVKDITDYGKGIQSKIILSSLKKGGVLYGVCVKNARGLIGYELTTNRRFGSELADYVRVHAGLGGIFHSDELPKYGITEENINDIKRLLGCGESDAFILITGPEERVKLAVEVIKKRIEQAKEGIPEETRSPKDDGTTSYSRPLPGAARMYPETDVKPVIIDEEYLRYIDSILPPLPEERKEYYMSLGLSNDMVERLVKDRNVFLFDYLVERGINPKLAASFILNYIPYWRREGIDVDNISYERWYEIVSGFEILYPKGAVDDVVKKVSEGYNVNEAVDILGVRLLSEEEVRKVVEQVINEFREEGKELKHGSVIGEVMKRTKGRASGKLVSDIVKKLLGG